MRNVVIAVLVTGVLGSSACRQAPSQGSVATGARSTGLNRQDELLLAAANVALPPPGITLADLPDPNSPGAKLIGTYCGQCHNAPSPQMHSATDWPSVARRMWLRMELLPPTLGVKTPTLGERLSTAVP